MPDFDTPQNELERAIDAVTAAGEDLDASARRAVFVALTQTDVAVLLPQRDEVGNPPAEVVPLFVSDGANLEQAMLAVFTRRERAEAFKSEETAAETQEIAGTQMLLGVPENAGIMINPNQPLNFRVLPDLAKLLREEVSATLERLSRETLSPGDGA